MGSVGDAVGGVLDTVTGGAFDITGQKKEQKKMRRQAEEQQKRALEEQENEKKKQQQATKDFYESIQQGSLGLLSPKQNQTIG